jgi:hypothetical protein
MAAVGGLSARGFRRACGAESEVVVDFIQQYLIDPVSNFCGVMC